MTGLGDFLDAHRCAIVQCFTERSLELLAPQGTTDAQRIDELPSFLADVAKAVRGGGWPGGRLVSGNATARAHGRQRIRSGYSLNAVVREYGLLRDCIYQQLEESNLVPPLSELRLLSACLSAAIADSVNEYVREQHAGVDAERLDLLGLFHQAPGFVCFLRGPDLVFELANAAYLQLVGHRDVLGKPVREALPEVAGQGFFELLDEVFASGEPFVGRGMAVALQREPGAPLTRAYIDFIYQPIVGNDGVTTGVLVEGQDVTEAKRLEGQRRDAEVARRASEERYRTLFESIDDGYCLLQTLEDERGETIDYRFLETNAAFERQTGLTNAVGKTARELVPDLDASWFRLYGEVARTGKQNRFENYAPAMGRWFDTYANRVGAPELRHVAVVFKDVTERKGIETALRESEERFRNMADNAPVMLWVADASGSCSYLSKGWYDFTGQNRTEALGLGWLSAAHPDDAERTSRVYLSANAKHEAFRLEYRLRFRDGTYRWVIDSATPRFALTGEYLGYIGSVIDIEERKSAEEERERLFLLESAARRHAEEASRLKDEFLATVSHELRTPLTSMLGWVQMLRTGNLPVEKYERGLETIERNARAQAQLIEDLLDVSRILAGKLRLDIEPTDPRAIVEAAIETVRPAADAKELRLHATLQEGGVVMGDPQRLQQVVWNLLSNAVKFTPRGGLVDVSLKHGNASAEITVADSGRGIEKDFQPHVFERFRQADAGPTRAYGGLGLGLSIVRQLTELHGGTVSVFSEGLGRGASFTVTLPTTVDSRGETDRFPALERIPTPRDFRCPPELAGLSILAVDDEEDTREMLRTLLEGCGARVRVAASVEEALRHFEEESPAILISDLGMPVQDGYTLIGKVRAKPPEEGGDVPAVALTAYARVEDRTRALLTGFDNHVAKPVEPLELLAVITSLAVRERRRGS